MRSAPFRRPFALITGLWFLALMLEPVPLHTCAMHGGASHGGASHGASTAAAPLAGHHHHAASVPQPKSPSPSSHSAACTCLGACAGGVAVQLPAAPELAWVSVARRAAARPRAPRQLSAAARPGLRLPFANAPPAFSLS